MSGLCFAVFVLILASIRELFGAASFAGKSVEALKDYKIGTLTQASGGLCVFAILLAVVNRIFPSEDGMGKLTRSAIGFDSEEKEA